MPWSFAVAVVVVVRRGCVPSQPTGPEGRVVRLIAVPTATAVGRLEACAPRNGHDNFYGALPTKSSQTR